MIPMKQPVILAIEKLGKSVTKWEFGTAAAPAPVKRVYKTGLSRSELSPEQLSPVEGKLKINEIYLSVQGRARGQDCRACSCA